MPKVKSFSCGFEGGRFQVVFNVDSRGTFTAALPLTACEVLGYTEVSGDTLEACERNFKIALSDYETAQTVTRQVILYRVKSKARIWNGEKVTFESDGIHFCEGVGIAVAAWVMQEHTITQPGKLPKYHYTPVEGNPLNRLSICSGRVDLWPAKQPECMLEWTQEREDFFIKVCRGLEAVILQLEQLKEPEKALALADSGLLALPASQ